MRFVQIGTQDRGRIRHEVDVDADVAAERGGLMAAKPTKPTKTPGAKPKLAFYWAASCGGCEITITELGMRLVDVGELVDIVFWPAAMDFKYEDVAALKDKEIDICFYQRRHPQQRE